MFLLEYTWIIKYGLRISEFRLVVRRPSHKCVGAGRFSSKPPLGSSQVSGGGALNSRILMDAWLDRLYSTRKTSCRPVEVRGGVGGRVWKASQGLSAAKP